MDEKITRVGCSLWKALLVEIAYYQLTELVERGQAGDENLARPFPV